MSRILHQDSLMLFESNAPLETEIVDVLESYVEDQLRDRGLLNGDLTRTETEINDNTTEVTFEVGGSRYFVWVMEWDHTQGVAIPLVVLISLDEVHQAELEDSHPHECDESFEERAMNACLYSPE